MQLVALLSDQLGATLDIHRKKSNTFYTDICTETATGRSP